MTQLSTVAEAPIDWSWRPPEAAPALSVRCFGPFSLTVNGQRVQRWRAGKTRALFHLLLANRNTVVLKEHLQERLWPGAGPAAATSLKVAVHALRRILDAAPNAEGRTVQIEFVDVGYMLRVDDLWLDVDEFARLCREGEFAAAAGDDATARQCLSAAMDLYRGDYLAQESAEWIEEHRQWYRALALQALETLRTEAIARGDLMAAAGWCRRTVEIDPYHERSYQVLMSVHGRRGERGLVRSWYEVCHRRLRELAVDPDPTTHVVYERAMRGLRAAPV